MTFWNQIRNLFSRSKQTMNEASNPTVPNAPVPPLDQKAMVHLMKRLEMTMENAYSCEEAYALLDEYVEMVASNQEAKKLMPLVKNHLDMCPDCRDEFEILLHVLQTAES